MKNDITKQMKRIQVILFLTVILLLFFGGCKDDAVKQQEKTMGMSETGEAAADGEIDGSMSTVGREGENSEDSLVSDQLGNVSDRRMEIVCRGDLFYKSLTEVGANGTYIVYMKDLDAKERYLGRIPAEEAELQDFDLPLADGKIALASCIDSQGNWHIMIAESGDRDQAQIWVVSADGNLERTVDISEIRKSQQLRPFYMAVDSKGYYYMDNGGILLILDEDGKLKYRTEDQDVAGLGVGRSGLVYGVFLEEDATGAYLARILPEDGSVERCPGGEFGTLGAKFSSLQPGVNCELLLGNMADGVWEYRDGELIKVLEAGELPCSGQNILTMGFLDDGRLCVMEYRDREKTNVFYYVPAERQSQE